MTGIRLWISAMTAFGAQVSTVQLWISSMGSELMPATAARGRGQSLHRQPTVVCLEPSTQKQERKAVKVFCSK
jgi:hypothetical protein